MKKAEIIIIIISIIALIMNLLFVPGGGALTVISLSLLSLIYFHLGFAIFNDIRLRKIFKKESYNKTNTLRIIGAIGTGIALSILIIGILFKFQSWPGAFINLVIGLIGLLPVVIIGLIKYVKNKSSYYTKIFLRVMIFGIIGVVLTFISESQWIEIKYRNHPSFANALIKAKANPYDNELWQVVEEERQKINVEN